ncbi:MAG: hypothetical protein FJ286_15265 [Planctomycetes bacterium]|nr:hypothetical protein [Planctomycetota bacterium]
MTKADELLRGVELALAGDWDAAHDLAQRHEGDVTADWLHAVLHKLEGDTGNARYWYRRCGRLDRAGDDPATELEAIRESLEPRGRTLAPSGSPIA